MLDDFDTKIGCEETYVPTAADWVEFSRYLDECALERDMEFIRRVTAGGQLNSEEDCSCGSDN